MPDNSILFELCQVLDINVNELLSGEKLSAGNIIWYYDMPSLVLIVVLMLIAAVTILGKVNDMSMLGPHAAVAILTLLYSLVLEVLLLPVAAKLWALEKVE